MKKDYILFIDSGIGGLSTLSETFKNTPANYLYFADNKHSPYGNHSKIKIYSYIHNIVSQLIKTYNIKIIVLACNTATTASIEKLRKEFAYIKFIGTEPAINVAYKNNYNKILSIATPATIKQNKYKQLMLKVNANVCNLSISTFAKCIEEYYTSNSLCSYFNMLKNIYLIAHKSNNFDCLVLGCTHYVLLKDKICKIANKPAFDGNLGVSKQVQIWYAKNYNPKNINKGVKFLFSNENNNLKQIYKKIFNEILAKT